MKVDGNKNNKCQRWVIGYISIIRTSVLRILEISVVKFIIIIESYAIRRLVRLWDPYDVAKLSLLQYSFEIPDKTRLITPYYRSLLNNLSTTIVILGGGGGEKKKWETRGTGVM